MCGHALPIIIDLIKWNTSAAINCALMTYHLHIAARFPDYSTSFRFCKTIKIIENTNVQLLFAVFSLTYYVSPIYQSFLTFLLRSHSVYIEPPIFKTYIVQKQQVQIE